MANVNKVILIGRLTRDAEEHVFNNGGKVANFTLAVNNLVGKDEATGKWKEEASFIDCKLFSRGERAGNVDAFRQYVRRGNQVYVEGHIRQEKWQDQEGNNRSKLVVRVDSYEILESPREEGGAPAMSGAPAHSNSGGGDYSGDYGSPPVSREPKFDNQGSEEDIPF